MALIFDIETNGLVKTMTKIHCIVTYDTEKDEIQTYTKDFHNAVNALERSNSIIGHNIIGFDIPAIQKLYLFNPSGTIVDTLQEVRRIWPNIENEVDLNKNTPEELRKRHSLNAWGYRLGNHKGEYNEGWEKFTPKMLEYCIQDVKVTIELWKLIISKS